MAGTIVVDRIESDASYASTINVAGQITFSNTVNFGAYSGTAPVAGFYLPTTNNLAFTTASTERMRIDNAGNVGIGTNNPTGDGTALHINASTYAHLHFTNSTTGTTVNDGFDIITVGSDILFRNRETAAIQFATTGTERMRIDSAGNLMLGTGTASGKFTIVDNSGGAGVALPIVVTNGVDANFYLGLTGSTATDKRAYIGPSTATALAFITNNTERMRIDSSGNVGIGLTNPSIRLDVVGASAASAVMIKPQGSLPNNNDNAGLYVLHQGTGGTAFRVRTDNAVSASYFAHILVNNASAAATALQVDQYGTSPIASFTKSGTAALHINSSGNVLIGTTAINTIGPRLTILGMTAGNQWSCGPTSGNDSFFIYNQSSVGVYLGYGNTSWSSSSDERIKTAIIPFENALEKVCTLRAGTGRYLTDEETVSRSFLIAQDVQAVLPEAVNVLDDEIGTLGLQYTDVIPLLVAAIKEQQALIQSLTARITALESN